MLFQEILQFVSDLSEPKIFVVNVIRLVIKLIRRAFRHRIVTSSADYYVMKVSSVIVFAFQGYSL